MTINRMLWEAARDHEWSRACTIADAIAKAQEHIPQASNELAENGSDWTQLEDALAVAANHAAAIIDRMEQGRAAA